MEDLKTRISHVAGLFVGQLSEDELRDFNAACREGVALRSYEGTAGLMGVATVRLVARAEA